MVSALLSFTLVFSVSAQTDSEVKPDGGNASAEASSTACPYKVTENDNVYLQISNVKLRSDDLPLYPYFSLRGMINGEWKYITETYSQEGNQICEKVSKPSNFQIYFDKNCQDYFVNVYSKWHTGNQRVVNGVKFNVEKLLKWADDPQNKDKTFTLEISKGNTIELKKVKIEKDRYYFQIVSYKITSIDNEYKKHLYESYPSWVTTQQEGFADKKTDFDYQKYTPAVNDTPDFANLSFEKKDKSKGEFLFSCKSNKKVKFTIANKKMGELDTIELSTDEVVKQLNDCMQKFPKDNTKWVVKCSSESQSEIELSFAGISRIYRVTTIKIPMSHPKRQLPDYAQKGKTPLLRVYIRQNDIPCGIDSEYASLSDKAWEGNPKDDKDNRFEIREGINALFSLYIKDANTVWNEVQLVEISEITDLDFSKKVIYEKLDMLDNDKRSYVKFEEVKD